MRVAAIFALVASSAVAAEKGADPKGAWIKLFADADWYKQQPGKETVFRGKLEAVQPPQVSTLMRNAYYKLAGRTIYTGGQKVAALDKRVGAEVEIRGKAVDMNLEGQALKEIWPASVRTVNRARKFDKRIYQAYGITYERK
jgi:hypothetical protein